MQPYRASPDVSRMAPPEVAQRFLDALCDFDVDLAASLLCDDSRLSFGSIPGAIGKPKVRSALIQGLGAVFALQCTTAAVWIRRDVAIIEADLDCERIDRARVSFPATIILRFRGGLIREIRLLAYEPSVIGHFPALRGTTVV